MKDQHTGMGESDSPIVLGDGKTDHMGKGRAARSTEHSTHTGKGKLVPNKSVSRTLLELKVKAERDRKYRFRSLFREIDLWMLYDSFYALRRGAASGVDGVSYEDYESNLYANLKDLLDRLATHRYRAKLIRRRRIPKDEGKTRALGMPAIEDKIVQMSARRLLEAIYEADFLDSSMGCRPNRGARDASQKLRDGIFESRVHWIVEADIKGFFDNMDHDWLIQMIEQRVADSHFIRLIRKWLRAGVMEEDGCIVNPTTGTPQGGIVSPILANIHLHYVLDLWVENVARKRSRGDVVYQRYADDFVVGFEYGDEAESFFSELAERLGKFGLSLSMEKSGIVRFSRFDDDGSGPFTYLGFDFYWARTRRGKKTIKRRTTKKKHQASLKSLKEWVRNHSSLRLRDMKATLRSKFRVASTTTA